MGIAKFATARPLLDEVRQGLQVVLSQAGNANTFLSSKKKTVFIADGWYKMIEKAVKRIESAVIAFTKEQKAERVHAEALVRAVHRTVSHPSFKGQFLMSGVHGAPYSGPNWAKEFEALRSALGIELPEHQWIAVIEYGRNPDAN